MEQLKKKRGLRDKKVMKKYLRGILLFALLGFVFMWFMRFSHIRVFQKQMVESEQGNHFIAEEGDIQQIALCADTPDAISVINKQATGELQIFDLNGKMISASKIDLTKFGINQFGEPINISSQPFHLEKGQRYSFSVNIDNQDCRGVSLCLYGKSVSILPLYIVTCILILLVLATISYLFGSLGDRSFGVWFFISVLMIGMLYNFIMPKACAPDESVHFSQTYAYANRLLGREVSNGRYTDVYESGICRLTGDVNAQNVYDFWIDWNYGNQDNTQKIEKYVVSNVVPFYAYLPATIALTVARMINAPYQIILLSGRIFNLVFFALLCLLAMKCYRPMRYAIAVIAMLPSTIWLVASYSYDGWNLGFCILFVAICLRIREQQSGMRLRDIGALLLVLLAFVPVKYIYVTIALTVFVIPFSQWKDKRLLWGCVLAAMVLVVTMAMVRGPEILSYLTSSNMDVRGRLADGTSNHYTVGWVMHHPGYVVMVYCKTVIQYTDRFISKGMVGEFYNRYVPTFLTAAVIVIFGLLMLTNEETDSLYSKCRLKGIIILTLGCAAVYSAFLFIYSNISEPVIGTVEGMQGRYFIPFFIFLPLIFYSKGAREFLQKEKDRIGLRQIETQEILLYLMLLLNLWIIFCKFAGLIQT